MKSKILWTLVWVNVALLVGWALKLTTPTAQAQMHRPGDYLMIPGEIVGGTSALVYVLDTEHGQLSAVTYDDSSGKLFQMPPIDLNQLFAAAMGGR